MPESEFVDQPHSDSLLVAVPEEVTPEMDPVVDSAIGEGEPVVEDLGEGGKAALAAEREARRKAEAKLRDLRNADKELREVRAALKQFEDRDKSEVDLLRERAESAERAAEEAAKSVAAAELSALRSKVAAVKGVPGERLTGDTEEELAASADQLIEWRDLSVQAAIKRVVPSTDGLKSGATGSGNTNPDPKAAAAEALRLMRAQG